MRTDIRKVDANGISMIRVDVVGQIPLPTEILASERAVWHRAVPSAGGIREYGDDLGRVWWEFLRRSPDNLAPVRGAPPHFALRACLRPPCLVFRSSKVVALQHELKFPINHSICAYGPYR